MIVSARLKALIALLVVVPLGCSFSYSSESSSKSLASPFTSSASSSSSGGSTQQAYRDDVRDYTYAYVSSRGGDVDAFQRGLGDIARKHGVTNWEEDSATYRGIGAGLAKARVSGVAFATFKQNLGRGDPSKMDAIQEGYDSYGK